jgi:hypothetical protein
LQTQSLQPSTSYGSVYPAYYTCSSHYAQAYYPQVAPQSAPAAGFNISSAATNAMNTAKGAPAYLMSTWYQVGNIRCSHLGCTFQGSHKSVEIHKMDRHLIYPPGWDKRKKKSEWDADPSLKGYFFSPSRKRSLIISTSSPTENLFQSKVPMSSWTHLNSSTRGYPSVRSASRRLRVWRTRSER